MDSRDDNACRALLAAVVANGLLEDDFEFVLGPVFAGYCSLVGLEPDTILETRIRYCLNELNPLRFRPICMDAKRFDADDAPVMWASWGRSPR